MEAVVEAFVTPALEMRSEAGTEGPVYRALAARLYVDPPPQVAEIRREIFEPVNERFREALASALPDATAQQVALALQLALGVLVHMLSVHAPTPETPSALLPQLFRQLVVFSAAGIEALCREALVDTTAPNAPDRGGS